MMGGVRRYWEYVRGEIGGIGGNVSCLRHAVGVPTGTGQVNITTFPCVTEDARFYHGRLGRWEASEALSSTHQRTSDPWRKT